jgi:catechol 2,3-dioxygenase-like lactoylglutathione lyase family enzyme
MATRFGHLCFLVTDLARAQAFYTRHFGLQVEKLVPGLDGKPSAFLTLGGVTFLELWEAEAPGAMHGHLALWVDDIEAFAQTLAGEGITVSPRDLRPSGNTIAFLNDPDGNTIELLCAPRPV